jgi:4-diphosphocytidyl-2-C-methyl-D-erythritol kinase
VPMIADILRALKTQPGCQLARMSGSGATCFGVFGSVDQVRLAAERLQSQHPEWWVSATALR